MTTAPDTVHHLLRDPKNDLLPVCGAAPGRDPRDGDFNMCHDQDLLLECISFGLCCCSTCLSAEALGGWSPLIPDHVVDENDR